MYITDSGGRKKKNAKVRKFYALTLIFLRIQKNPNLVNFSDVTAESIRVALV